MPRGRGVRVGDPIWRACRAAGSIVRRHRHLEPFRRRTNPDRARAVATLISPRPSHGCQRSACERFKLMVHIDAQISVKDWASVAIGVHAPESHAVHRFTR